MKNIGTGLLLTVATACFFYGCSSTSSSSDFIPPVIQLDNPDSNGLVINGDTMRFTGTITDDQKLHSMLLTIEGMQGQIYYSYNPTVDGMISFHFDTPWLVYGIPYDTTGYLNLIITDQNENYAVEHWYMRLRN